MPSEAGRRFASAYARIAGTSGATGAGAAKRPVSNRFVAVETGPTLVQGNGATGAGATPGSGPGPGGPSFVSGTGPIRQGCNDADLLDSEGVSFTGPSGPTGPIDRNTRRSDARAGSPVRSVTPGATGSSRQAGELIALAPDLMRVPSWAEPSQAPPPGCWCICCRGSSWWCEREVPKGWRCATCHSPSHLAPDAVLLVSADHRSADRGSDS